jgi:hypothetical protein
VDDREGGFIFWHRRLYSSPVWRSLTKGQRWVFQSVLVLANYRRKPLGYFGGELVYVERGELAHEVEKIAAHAEESYATARKAIEKLVTFGVLEVRWSFGAHNRVRILRVVNYERYQRPTQQPNNETGDDRTTAAQQPHNSRTTREEGEEGKKKDSAPAPQAPPLLAAAPLESDTPPAAPPATAPGAKPAPERRTDARVSPLTAAMASAYEQERGDKYLHGGAKDATALKRLLSVADGEEIIRRWRLALRDEGFHRCDSFAQLAQSNHWNHYARGTTQGPRSLRKLTA